jgi:hypothetical protein
MMTTRLMKLKFIVVATVCLACLGTFPAFSQDIGDPVTIEKDRILIPGTNISESDQRAVNAILAKYDKSLYKLKGYVKGKAEKPKGTLNDAPSIKLPRPAPPSMPRTRTFPVGHCK